MITPEEVRAAEKRLCELQGKFLLQHGWRKEVVGVFEFWQHDSKGERRHFVESAVNLQEQWLKGVK